MYNRSYRAVQIAVITLVLPSCVHPQRVDALAQSGFAGAAIVDSTAPAVRSGTSVIGAATTAPTLTFESRVDSLAWQRAKTAADGAKGLHVTVSLKEFHLWAIDGVDTLLSTTVAVAKGETIEIQGRRWTFVMPRGVRTVRGKEADPIWIPPDWLYAETAVEYGLKLASLPGSVKLADGRRITVRDSLVGLIDSTGEWAALPVDEHIVFNHTLYIPPAGTINRRVSGQLGKYRLDLGDGFLLHGTPYQASIGTAATHGCVRLRDADIQWLYDNVPIGTKVYIY